MDVVRLNTTQILPFRKGTLMYNFKLKVNLFIIFLDNFLGLIILLAPEFINLDFKN